MSWMACRNRITQLLDRISRHDSPHSFAKSFQPATAKCIASIHLEPTSHLAQPGFESGSEMHNRQSANSSGSISPCTWFDRRLASLWSHFRQGFHKKTDYLWLSLASPYHHGRSHPGF